MNSIKIILAAVMIMLVSNFLTGCSPEQTEQVESSFKLPAYSELGMARIDAARETEKTVKLFIKRLNSASDAFQLVLENPAKQPITSVESWIAYDPAFLAGVNFKPNSDLFELEAPYENGFDADMGLIKFGRSTTLPVRDVSIVLAEFEVKKLDDSIVFLDAYDYQFDLSGHNSVNIMYQNEPVNLLMRPSSPLIVLSE